LSDEQGTQTTFANGDTPMKDYIIDVYDESPLYGGEANRPIIIEHLEGWFSEDVLKSIVTAIKSVHNNRWNRIVVEEVKKVTTTVKKYEFGGVGPGTYHGEVTFDR
jgi:hypothetical protein